MMSGSDDETRQPIENATSGSNSVEKSVGLTENLQMGCISSENSGGRGNRSVEHNAENSPLLGNPDFRDETLKNGQESSLIDSGNGNGDISYPNLTEIEIQLFCDRTYVGESSKAQSNNLRNEGEQARENATQLHSPKSPAEIAGASNGQPSSRLNNEPSSETLISCRNPSSPLENGSKKSLDSLRDMKSKLEAIKTNSRPNTGESTEVGSELADIESEFHKPSLEGSQPRDSYDHEAHKSSKNNKALNEIFADVISSAEPSLRHLASQNAPGDSGCSVQRSKSYRRANRLSTPMGDQRHPGKPNLWSGRFMMDIDEIVDWEAEQNQKIFKAANSSDDAFRGDDEHGVSSEEPQELETEYPGSIALTFLMIGLCLSVFLISLDRTIITTAIPYISGEFKSYADVGWYGSAYLLTACAFQPVYGRIFSLFSIKWSYIAANALFEIGSLICGVAPNSTTLIVGRAIAGVGSAGILTGSFVVIAHSLPMHKRPVFTAAVGLMFGVGATVGPLLGGVFTDEVTWRWCFYFNLPVGGVTILAMIAFFNPKTNIEINGSFGSRLLELDIIGNILLLGTCIMLFIALQYTEMGYAWSSSTIIGLLVGFGVTLMALGFWLWYRGDQALIPLEILEQRSVLASCFFSFFIYSALIIHSYYIPQWFQAIKGTSAITAGLDVIPYVVCNASFSLLAGIVVSKTGYFTPPTIFGTAIATVGCALISILQTDTSTAQWAGYEILSAAGFGIAIQQGFTAVQTVLPLQQIPIGTAAVVASQSFGGAIFVSVGNNILQNQLRASSESGRIPGVDIQAVLDAGANGFRSIVDADKLPALLVEYNSALQKVFSTAIPVAGLAFVASLFLEWKSVKPPKETEKL